MGKRASTARSTVRSNWGLAFVFNKTLMGGGVLAEGRRQWVAKRSGELVIARDRVSGKPEVLTTARQSRNQNKHLPQRHGETQEQSQQSKSKPQHRGHRETSEDAESRRFTEQNSSRDDTNLIVSNAIQRTRRNTEDKVARPGDRKAELSAETRRRGEKTG
jgi:hypothetical protein